MVVLWDPMIAPPYNSAVPQWYTTLACLCGGTTVVCLCGGTTVVYQCGIHSGSPTVVQRSGIPLWYTIVVYRCGTTLWYYHNVILLSTMVGVPHANCTSVIVPPSCHYCMMWMIMPLSNSLMLLRCGQNQLFWQ
jgi:hypothetical protein